MKATVDNRKNISSLVAHHLNEYAKYTIAKQQNKILRAEFLKTYMRVLFLES